MKHYAIIVTRDALKDLVNIQKYLINNFGQKSADKQVKKMKKVFKNLSASPFLGVNLNTIFPLTKSNYHLLRMKHNIVFYGIYNEEKVIRILHVYSSKQNFIKRILNYLNKRR